MINAGKKLVIVCTAATGLAAVIAAPSLANHAWGDYHWERMGPQINIPVIDNTTGVWAAPENPPYVAIAVADWNSSQFIEAALYQGSADPSCPLSLAEIHVCNDNYGGTGWVGLASIAVTRGRTTHIIAGVTKLNDYYFDQSYYNNDTWRQLVTCQEIGHDYGLGHQNTNFNTDLTTSCMEYTSQPAGNEHPDDHDYQMLATIYGHSHGGEGTTDTGTVGGKGKKIGIVGDAPADWGTPIGRDAHGRANVYKRALNGFDLITHVTWAIGEAEEDHHQSRRPHEQ